MLIPDKRFDYPQAFQFGVRPPGQLRIDESHPLAISDYDYVFSQGRGDTITDLQGQLALTAVTPLWTSTYHGVCGDFASTDANKFTASGSPIITSDGVGTGDFGFLIAGYFVRESAQGFGFTARKATSAFNGTYLSVNDGDVAGNISFVTTASSANSLVAVTNAFPSSGFYVFGGVRKGTTLTLYRNGIAIGSSSPTLRDITVSGQEMSIGGLDSSGTGIFNGCVHLVRLFNRYITPGQMYKMSTDIYGHMI